MTGNSDSGPVSRAVTRVRRRAGTLPRQLALVVAIALAPVLLALVVFSMLMLVSGHAVWLVVLVLVVGVLALVGSRLIAGGIMRDVEAIRDALMAVGRGDRDVRITTNARDELAELAAAANAMIADLGEQAAARDQSESARRDLVAAVSHDLRTPITSLRLLAEALDDDIVVDEETRRSYLTRMRVNIDALSALIDDLFELSRLEAGDINWSLEQVPVGELVGETVDAMRAEAEAKGVAVLANVPDDLSPARGNPEKLQRVLFNLIQNAIRHTPADGSVVVRAQPVASGIEVEIVDSGDGIPPEDRERVFTAFYRGGTDAARTGDGAGLGLAISKAIVEAHGGRIWLADTPLGTSVRFRLPVAS
ncbi:MAG: HAMP domain-containing sensor histidine kinase [Solirubrobacteraceae bacterium]